MKVLIQRGLWMLLAGLLALPAAGPAMAAPAAAPSADGPNLLQNPGFESPFVKQCCQTDLGVYLPNTPIDEVQVAQGWLGWWLVPGDADHPGSCETQGCVAWHRPEWREANCGSPCSNRVRSEGNAQKYFTFFSVHEAGMYQQVGGITPGARLRFNIYMQAWSTNENYGESSGQSTMGMRVGIDPFGGTNPYSANIIWSPTVDTYDAWGLYSVEAIARAGMVTVFTRSQPGYALQHNDIYLDDASLVVVSASSSGNTGGSGTGGSNPPPAAPAATATSVGGFAYVVKPGDNYYRIAQRFGVSVQSIYNANQVTNPNLLYVGVVLIIPGVAGPGGTVNPPPANTPVPGPAATTPPSQLPGVISYVVQRGDNLYRLSLRFGTTIARIKQLNNLTSDIIYIGQTLIIAP